MRNINNNRDYARTAATFYWKHSNRNRHIATKHWWIMMIMLRLFAFRSTHTCEDETNAKVHLPKALFNIRNNKHILSHTHITNVRDGICSLHDTPYPSIVSPLPSLSKKLTRLKWKMYGNRAEQATYHCVFGIFIVGEESSAHWTLPICIGICISISSSNIRLRLLVVLRQSSPSTMLVVIIIFLYLVDGAANIGLWGKGASPIGWSRLKFDINWNIRARKDGSIYNPFEF